LAIRDGSVDILEVLLDFGADPSVRDERGNTGVHMAAAAKRADMIRVLARRAGPKSLNAANDYGECSSRAEEKADDARR